MESIKDQVEKVIETEGLQKSYYKLVLLKNGKYAVVDKDFVPRTKIVDGKEQAIEINLSGYDRISGFEDGVAIASYLRNARYTIDGDDDYYRRYYEITIDGEEIFYGNAQEGVSFSEIKESPLREIYKNPNLLKDGKTVAGLYTEGCGLDAIKSVMEQIMLDTKLNENVISKYDEEIVKARDPRKREALIEQKRSLETRIEFCKDGVENTYQKMIDMLRVGDKRSQKIIKDSEKERQKRIDKYHDKTYQSWFDRDKARRKSAQLSVKGLIDKKKSKDNATAPQPGQDE